MLPRINLKVWVFVTFVFAGVPALPAYGFTQSDFEFVPKCQEDDGSLRWEIINHTSQVLPWKIRAVDNHSLGVYPNFYGSTLPNGQGNGSSLDRTIAHSTRGSTGGRRFELEIQGFKYQQDASTSTCPNPTTASSGPPM